MRLSNRSGRRLATHWATACSPAFGSTENVTTNYDTLFETALGGPEKCSVLPYAPVSRDKPWLLKLHGSVDRPDDIVLTRTEYLGLPERAGALFGILQAMLMTRHMLFVGYSLTDDSFHKVMHEVRRARSNTDSKDKVGTALLLTGDPLLQEMWDLDLDFISMSPDPLPSRKTSAKTGTSAARPRPRHLPRSRMPHGLGRVELPARRDLRQDAERRRAFATRRDSRGTRQGGRRRRPDRRACRQHAAHPGRRSPRDLVPPIRVLRAAPSRSAVPSTRRHAHSRASQSTDCR